MKLDVTSKLQMIKEDSKEYSLSAYDANILVSEVETALFFEKVAKGRDQKLLQIGSQVSSLQR